MNLSVVIPNYNGSRTIEFALKSVFDQIPVGSEVIVVDDLSTDDSINLIRNHFHSVNIYVNNSNQGSAATRNRGLNLAHGDWVLFIDSDVCLEPGCLNQLVKASDGVDIVFPTIVYPNGETMYPVGEAQKKYLLISPIFLLRKSSLSKLDRPVFDETYRIYCEDTDFFLRAYIAGIKARYVPEAEATHNVNLQAGNREDRYFLEVRNTIYGVIKFAFTPEINCLDHAFKLSNFVKVLLCGLFNFNLFDMRARGYHKQSDPYHNLIMLLGKHNNLTSRGSIILIYLSLKAAVWNLRHLPSTLRIRKQMHREQKELQVRIVG